MHKKGLIGVCQRNDHASQRHMFIDMVYCKHVHN